jgi:hypothetical protein
MIAHLIAWVLALAGVAVAAYAHYRLRFHTTTRAGAEIARLVLILAGTGLGWTAILWAPQADPLSAAPLFLIGFGMVHVPAAFILWSKRQRGVYR